MHKTNTLKCTFQGVQHRAISPELCQDLAMGMAVYGYVGRRWTEATPNWANKNASRQNNNKLIATRGKIVKMGEFLWVPGFPDKGHIARMRVRAILPVCVLACLRVCLPACVAGMLSNSQPPFDTGARVCKSLRNWTVTDNLGQIV